MHHLTKLFLALTLTSCSSASKKPTESGPSPTGDPLTAVIVQDCIGIGIAADACACVGEHARTHLTQVLLEKMASQPQERSAIENHYQTHEVFRITEWMVEAETACEISGEEP